MQGSDSNTPVIASGSPEESRGFQKDFPSSTDNLPVTALSAQSTPGFDSHSMIRELVRIGELVLCMAWRDLRVRYKQSVLGLAWAVIQPLALMVVFASVLGPAVSMSVPDATPYGLFAFCGLVPWTFFSGALSQCANSLVANRNLVTKVYFPRESFPFSCVAAGLVDFAVGLLALAGLMAYYDMRGTWTFTWHTSLLFLPAIILVLTILASGLGLVLAMGNLFYRDVRPMLTVALQLAMFVSAVVVPVPSGSSSFARIVHFNPLVPIIAGFRDCLLVGRLPDMAGFCYSALISIIVLAAGWTCFRKASFAFAECI